MSYKAGAFFPRFSIRGKTLPRMEFVGQLLEFTVGSGALTSTLV